MKKRISPGTQILISVILSILLSFVYAHSDVCNAYIENKIAFVGQFFISSLKLFAVPLILFSVISSMRNVEDTQQLLRMGLFVLALYSITTFLSVCFGILLGNVFQPGVFFRTRVPSEALENIPISTTEPDILEQNMNQNAVLPDNFFALLSNNGYLPLIVLFAVIFGIALFKDTQNGPLVFQVCEGLRLAFMKIIGYIIVLAPVGIFCLIFSQLTSLLKNKGTNIQGIFLGLGFYAFTIIVGLLCMILLVYPLMVRTFSSTKVSRFMYTMRPAQVFAFSISSSTAALIKTKEQVGKLGVSERVRNFVLSLGAAINMDGTAVYLGVVVIFVIQLFGNQPTMQQQIYIAGCITMLSMGIASIPGGSLITISMLLNTLLSMHLLLAPQIPIALGLVTIPDSLLDRMRTVTNITGDATAAVLVQARENRKNSTKKHS